MAERDAKGLSVDRDTKGKERTPPPRPIVPPEGQQQNPALREECAWLGQRIVSLLFRDDAMSGNDFIPVYMRFGCPDEHLSKAFGCVVSNGMAENDVLADRIAVCWTNPVYRRPPATASKSGEPVQPTAKPGEGGAKPADGAKPDGGAKPEGAAKPAEPAPKAPDTGSR